ncbi:MAG: glycosyltransferase family 9 protein [Limisphaerales bacterium]
MKILVISLAGNGDTLFATPLMHELRASFPDARIDALVMWPGAKGLLEGNPHLDAVCQKNLIADGRIGGLRFLWQLRRRHYDVSINTHPQSRIAYRLVARFIHARLRISHRYDNVSLLDRALVNRMLPQDYQRHSIENNLACLACLGVRPVLPEHDYEVYLSAAELAWAAEFIATERLSGRRLLGLHVGSGGTKNLPLRRWPLEHYQELLRRLERAWPDLAVLLFGGPDEQAGHARLLAAAGAGRVRHPPTQNLRQAAALLRHCHAFLSVDTVLMHLAAAVKVPGQVVIETPTWNRPIEPYRNPFVLVKNPVVAGRNLEYYRYDGRGIRGTPQELARCMASVPVEEVYRAVEAALQRRK